MSTPDQSLQALLANLRPRSQASTAHYENTNTSRDVSLTFPPTNTLPTSPPPPFSPVIPTGNAAPTNATAQNLLNLLNFGNSSASSLQAARSNSVSATHESPPHSTQDNVYNTASLLKRTKPTGTDKAASVSTPQSPAKVTERQKEADTADTSLARSQPSGVISTLTSTASGAVQPEASQANQETQKTLFTYKNPFEALRASRPHTPRTQAQPVAQPQQSSISQEQLNEQKLEQIPVPSIEDSVQEETLHDQVSDRVKLTPKSRASRQATPSQPSGLGQELPTRIEDETSFDRPEKMASPEPPAYTRADMTNVDSTHSNPLQPSETALHDTGGGSQPNGTAGRVVPVLTFPVKAFVSITLQLKSPSQSRIREEGVMEISRLKKEFDQIDRSLAAASSRYITYALVKNGGMRIIRQDDGRDRQIFKHTHDRVFNVSLCTTSMTAPPGDHQAVLGTGISGAVYYATICKQDADFFDSNELEHESLIFPAFPQADENTAGGVLKTRAKRSSRHPEFFAIGRGKAIHIVWPATAMNANYGITEEQRRVDVEKFFSERSLQILTGKAGKDFNFSEDDTMIVSLDKTGRLRFWDIRKLTDEENARSVHITPYVIDTPVLSLATAAPAEKSWPTSVLFVDKARPYIKGGALRYVLVGLRQNHTLQLWDIALGKAVQEINFPHQSETDGICSVTYHPTTGIIAVGHPTRNSIFFIHLSAPRYVLSSSLTQASFVQRVAAKDPDIPKPESTACMSGIRELSFEGRGQLRSVELLPVYKQGDNVQTDTNDAQFELYVAHSTGVTCLVINKEDLGWNSDSKIIHSIDAEKDGLVTLKDLKLGSVIDESARSKSPLQEPPPYSKADKKKKPKKPKDTAEETTNGGQEVQSERLDAVRAIDPSQQEQTTTEATTVEQALSKESKKSRKKKDLPSDSNTSLKQDNTKPSDTTQPRVDAGSDLRRALSPNSHQEPLSMSISGDWLDQEMKKLEKAVNSEFKKELDQLYQNIKTDRSSQDQLSASRQEAVLRVVSTTLSTNVEKTLGQILRTQMNEVVVPSVVQTVSIDLSQQIIQTVTQSVKKELSSEVPTQIDRTLQSPQMLTRIADDIAIRINGQIEQEISKAIHNTVETSMKSIAASTAAEVVAVAETRMADRAAHISQQHAAFNEKIEALNTALQTVTSTLQSMMQIQTNFQAQVLLDLQQSRGQDNSRPQSAHPTPAAFSPSPSVRAVPARQKTQADIELEEVASLMSQRRYEEGSIKWLQSSQPSKLFDELFVRFTPDYLATDVTPLVAFSIGVTVANNLSTNTQQRLEWIAAAFNTVDFRVCCLKHLHTDRVKLLTKHRIERFLSLSNMHHNYSTL